jgi:DNA repair exonuclease SbcCD ATPase subunit
MAFFSEIKAKLGLDITGFERGLSQAQNSGKGFAGKFGKQIAGTEKMGGALAAALGLNIQNIAENFARLWTGVSKGAEEAFERMTKASDAAAAIVQSRIERAREKLSPEKQREQFDRDRKRINRQMGILTRRNRLDEKYGDSGKTERIALNNAELSELALKLEQIGEAEEKLNDKVAKEKESNAKEAADKQEKDAEAARKAREQAFEQEQKDEEELAKLQTENAMNALSDEQKLAALKKRQADLYAKDTVKSLIEAEKLTSDILSIEEKITQEKEKQVEEDKKITQEKEKQVEEGKKSTAEFTKAVEEGQTQYQTLGQQLKDQAKATYSEVASGKRGTPTDRARAKQAERLRERARHIIDSGGEGAEERAAKLNAQAQEIQQSLTSTKSTEKSSLTADFADAFDKARVLQLIKSYLEPTATN